MTISSTARKAGPFLGDGVTVALPFSFKVFSAADLLVVQAVTATGVESTKTLTTDYTVSLNADQNATPGGAVNMVLPAPTGTTTTLTSQVANTQSTDLTNAGGFYPKVITDALDRATIQIQQVAERIGRALQLPISSGASSVLPAPVAGNLLGWDSLAQRIINYAGTLSGLSVSAFMATLLQSADAASTRGSIGLGGDGTLGFRNRLHNGDFRVNARAVSGTVTLAAAAYGHDRWKAGAAGCTYTFASSGSGYVITITAGSLLQIVEGVNVEGGVYSLANQGSAQARIAVNGAGTSGAYASATSAAPLQSASATGGQAVAVEFSTGTLDRVQLDAGAFATAFERRPYGIELGLCRRYYRKQRAAVAGTAGGAGSWMSSTVVLDGEMRVGPSIANIGNIATTNTTSASYDEISSTGFRFTAVASAAGQLTLTQDLALSADL